MTRPGTWKTVAVIFALYAATGIAAAAQTLTTLVRFDFADGAYPGNMSLVQGIDGNLYGTTSGGGAKSSGTVFRMTKRGALTTLYSFCSHADCADGASPYAGLVLATDGNFYGTTVSGGGGSCNNGCGTVFKITPGGRLTTLHSFDGLDGAGPCSALIQGTDGLFYGTTSAGGANNGGTTYACGGNLYQTPSTSGTIFRITSGGALTTLHSFGGRDGFDPVASLVQGIDGNFYGTTAAGGSSNCPNWAGGCGTVFRITPNGALTTLDRFNESDGVTPYAPLVLATDGNVYGTTYNGSNCYGIGDCGTVYQITPDGKLTTLIDFCGDEHCTSGGSPNAGLIQATDGNLYVTLQFGGPAGWDGGDVFETPPQDTRDNPPYAFCSQVNFYGQNTLCSDGAWPIGGLLQGTDGKLYGTTSLGGVAGPPQCQTANYGQIGCGTVFSLDMGLGPFVSLQRYSGRVGQTGGILGQGFTGTTSVSLNGTPSSFAVVSDTFIRATVPAGATTGFVTVTTPSGTLTSNLPFHVIP